MTKVNPADVNTSQQVTNVKCVTFPMTQRSKTLTTLGSHTNGPADRGRVPKQIIIILASDDHPNDLGTSTASAENASAPVWKREP